MLTDAAAALTEALPPAPPPPAVPFPLTQQAQTPMTAQPLVTHIYFQGSGSSESAYRPGARCIRSQQPKQPFANPAAESPNSFLRGQANLCACCSTLGTGDGYDCSQKSGPWRQRPGRGGHLPFRGLCPRRTGRRAHVPSRQSQEYAATYLKIRRVTRPDGVTPRTAHPPSPLHRVLPPMRLFWRASRPFSEFDKGFFRVRAENC